MIFRRKKIGGGAETPRWGKGTPLEERGKLGEGA